MTELLALRLALNWKGQVAMAAVVSGFAVGMRAADCSVCQQHCERALRVAPPVVHVIGSAGSVLHRSPAVCLRFPSPVVELIPRIPALQTEKGLIPVPLLALVVLALVVLPPELIP